MLTLEKRNDYVIANAHRYPYNQFPNITDLAFISNIRLDLGEFPII